MKRYAIVRTRCPIYHREASAPDHAGFLRNVHRHLFHITAWRSLENEGERIEYFAFQDALANAVARLQQARDPDNVPAALGWDCTAWAERLLEALDLDRVEVSEDGENGAQVERGPRVLTGATQLGERRAR